MRALLLFALLFAFTIPSPTAGADGFGDARAIQTAPIVVAQNGQPSTNNPGPGVTSERPGPWYGTPLRLAFGILVVLICILLLGVAIFEPGMTVGDAGYRSRVRSVNEDGRLWKPEPQTKDREPTLQSRVLARPERLKE